MYSFALKTVVMRIFIFSYMILLMNRCSILDGSDRTEMNGMAVPEPEPKVRSRILKELSSFWRSRSHNTMQHCFDGFSSDRSSSDGSSSNLYDL
jgi:hypothetical protein